MTGKEMSRLERIIIYAKRDYDKKCEEAIKKAEERKKTRPTKKSVVGFAFGALATLTVSSVMIYNNLIPGEAQGQTPIPTAIEMSIIPSLEPTIMTEVPEQTQVYIEPTDIPTPILTATAINTPIPTNTPQPDYIYIDQNWYDLNIKDSSGNIITKLYNLDNDSPRQIRDAAFSPDGNKVAFIEYNWPNGEEYIKIINSDGSGLDTLFTSNERIMMNNMWKEQHLSNIHWSSKGMLYFSRTEPISSFESIKNLYSLDLGTGNLISYGDMPGGLLYSLPDGRVGSGSNCSWIYPMDNSTGEWQDKIMSSYYLQEIFPWFLEDCG